MLSLLRFSLASSGVSIHAPRFREAMQLVHRDQALDAARFNPRPPFPGGDAGHEYLFNGDFWMFQSTPPVSGRRCQQAPAIGGAQGWFQSTPPVSGRRCRRFFMAITTAILFQSTPPVSGRRCVAGDAITIDYTPFQSTPPVSGRRCPGSRKPIPRSQCFNPRPPFPGGDALVQSAQLADGHVSIHAPRFREAMPWFDVQSTSIASFQSTPPVSGRRCGRGECAASR